MARNNTPEISPCSYAVAVALSGIFGILGIQHFYLGRWGLGLLDLSLSVAAFLCFFLGASDGWILLGLVLLGADFLHSLIVTILLLTGTFHDGQGRLVPYPGQKFR